MATILLLYTLLGERTEKANQANQTAQWRSNHVDMCSLSIAVV